MVSEVTAFRAIGTPNKRLNPYCSGIWSRSCQKEWQIPLWLLGLILIVVEYGLGGFFNSND